MSLKRPQGLRTELFFGAIAALTSASTGVNYALADEKPPHETVIVTGERKTDNPYADSKSPYRVKESASELLVESVQDTAKSIQILPKDLIDDMGISTFRDLFRTQPGITLGTGEGGNAFGDRIFVRGFDARNDVYIDGVRDPGVASREVFATQQIEILKGPSSTFGGRGTTGGAISLISKQPKAYDVTSVETTIGTQDTKRVTIDTTKIINDEISVRLNLMGHDGGVAGRDHTYNKRFGAAFALLYKPSDTLKINADYYHLNTDYMPDWGFAWDAAISAPINVRKENFYGLKYRDFGKTFSDVYTLNVEKQFSENLSLRSIIRYGQTSNQYQVSAPGGGIIVMTSAIKNAANTLTNANIGELAVRLSSPSRDQLTDYITNQTSIRTKFNTGALEHILVGGVEISREKTRMINYSFLECGSGTCTVLGGGNVPNVYQSLANPDYYLPWPADGRQKSGQTNIKTDTKALYFIDSIHLGEKWIATIGARQDYFDTSRNAVSFNSTPAAAPVSSESQFLSYNLGLVYKPVESVSLYTNYGTSKNPPCEQLDSTGVEYGGCTASTNAIDPIENRSFEIGGKFNVNGHFDVTGAFFAMDRKGVPSVVSNILFLEKQSVQGVEFTASGNINKKLSLYSGFSMLETNTDESTNPNSQNLGKGFANVSEMSFSLTTKYQWNEKFAIGGTFISQSKKFGGTYSAGTNFLDGFNRIDLMAQYELGKGKELRFNIQNLTDETYYDALYRSASPFVYVAPGRSASVTFDWHF